MSTIKPRINITADPDIEAALRSAARRDRVPVASKAAQLIRLALDIEEDFALSTLALARDSKSAEYIPADRFWGKASKP